PSGESLSERGRTDGSMDRGVFDPLAQNTTPLSAVNFTGIGKPEQTIKTGEKPRPPMVEFWPPSRLRRYEPPPNQNMVGDYHIQRGAIAVLAGPPGCGKSRAALCLAIAGARGSGEWLGLGVRCKFRTLILQNENGLARFHRDFAVLGVPD